MADVKISQLPAATTPLAGTEEIPLVQSGVTKRATVDDIVGSISGVVTSVTGTAPVVSSGGTTPAISMAAATGSVNGYLTSADWTTFNSKQPAGSYLTNGGALGTPSSGTATNLTGLPLTTGVTGVLPIANGGTNASTAATARGNILPSYSGNAGKVLAVNAGATDVEYIAASGSGTVTSVDVSGGTTGLTTSGGPVTAAGTITLAGTLAVANGGTGTSTPSLVAGTNVTITGTWPNQTINSSGGGSMTYPGAGIANSTGSAWDTSYSTSGTGTVVALATSPALTTPAITGGTINNTTIGATTPTTAVFTSLTVNDNSTFGSSNTDTSTFTGRVASEFTPSTNNTYDLGRSSHEWRNLYLAGTGNIASLVATTVDINGGTIDATTIGATTPSSGAFTTVTASTAIGIASGGTGQTTTAAAITALTGTQTSGYYLRSDGTNAALGAIQAADVPTLNQNTSGTAAGLSATLAVGSGGTGATSLTVNNVILGNGTSAVQVVAPGTAGNVLTSDGTTWASTAPAASGLTRAQVTAISLVFGF